MHPEIDELLLTAKFIKHKGYWLKKLEGIAQAQPTRLLHHISSPTSTSAPLPGFRRVDIALDELVVQRLMKLGKQSDLSIYIIFVAALKALIHRFTGSEDITVISPLFKANINAQTLNRQVFIRDRAGGGAPFSDWLLSVRTSVLEAYENQDYPSSKLTAHLFGAASDSLHPSPVSSITCYCPNIHGRESLEQGPRQPLVFCLHREENRIQSYILHDPGLFEEGYVQSAARHFSKVLEQITENPRIRVEDLAFTPHPDEARMIEESNNTAQPASQHRDLVSLFAQQAAACPAKPAIIDAHTGTQLTYEKLDKESSRLANYLAGKNIAEGAVAPLIMERSPEMVIAIMAILKTGAAFLPIDIHSPIQRMQFVLEESRATLLLTRKRTMETHKSLFQQLPMENIIAVDEDIPGADNGMHAVPDAHHTAYVIYTSGTSGKPKGVMVPHRAIANYILWAARTYVGGESLDFPLYTSISFDLTLTSLFTPLLTGNAVVIYRGEDDALSIDQVIRENRVGIVKLTPSHLKLLKHIDKEDCRAAHRIKRFIVGGEKLDGALAFDIDNRFGGKVEIYNEYGPTEAAVGCMIYRFDPDNDHNRAVPIGHPISNMQIHLLDSQLRPVPIGIPGELYISGAGLAAGYLNQPRLTAEGFVKYNLQISNTHDNLPPSSSLRLYRSGDLAVRLLDGNIQFLGRVDKQVKVRGYRIELEEIENRLLALESVEEAAVITRPMDEEGGNVICAYYVASEPLDLSETRERLAHDLPGYMIPSFFVPIPAIPLTINGKVDEAALPKPSITEGQDYSPPRDELEKSLAAAWADVLGTGRDEMGIDGNFFEMGGNSLKATILMARIHKELNVKVPLAQLFNTPRIRELALFIRGLEEQRFSAIHPAETREYYPLSSAQKRMFVLYQMDPRGTVYNVYTAVIVEGEPDPEKIRHTFNRLIQRHESLRTSFHILGGKPGQKIHYNLDFKLDYYDNAGNGNNKNGNNKMTPSGYIQPFDLGRPPLLRVALIREAPGRFIMIADMHHIVTDAISMEILIREFTLLYNDQVPPPLKLQYKDYALWQNQEYGKGLLKEQEQYWLKQFQTPPPHLNLPLDKPRPPVMSFAGNRINFDIPQPLASALNTLALSEGVTLYMVLFTAFNILLYKLSRQPDLIVGTSLAARRHADLEHIIGMFVNNLPVRNTIDDSLSFNRFLARVKQNLLDAFENQDYPFEQLVEQVFQERDTSRNPIFDVLFAFQSSGSSSAEKGSNRLGDLVIRSYQTERNSAKFDLWLNCFQDNDRLDGSIEYCTDLFEPATIRQFIDYYKTILEQAVRHPDAAILDMEIISSQEKQRLLRGDGAAKERLLLSSKFVKQRGYWEKKLSPLGGAEPTRLLFESPGQTGQEPLPQYETLDISGEVYERLMKLSKGSDIPIYLVLLTTLKLLIYKYTGDTGITVVSPLFKANVNEETLNDQLFIHDVIEEGTTYAGLLKTVRKSLLDAYENQDYPSAKLVERLTGRSLETAASAASLVTGILCSYAGLHDYENNEGDTEHASSREQLHFAFQRGARCIGGRIYYDASFHEPGYVKLAAAHFTGILAQLTGNPNSGISTMGFALQEEENRLMEQFNSTAAVFPGDRTLIDLFEEQAAKSPRHTAIIDGENKITYERLNTEANRLARRLGKNRTKGVIIPFIMDRSPEAVTGILAILKAGCAFLPIDKETPAQRQQFILQECEANMLLTQRHIMDGQDLEQLPVNQIIDVDEIIRENGDSLDNPPRTPEESVQPPGMAYIIYTSGTSGKPKGVMVSHRSIVNYIWWAARTYVNGQSMDFPLYTSLSFDLTLTSIFTPLITGNAIVIYEGEEDALLISRVIRENRAGAVKLTPSHLKLINQMEPETCASARNIKCFIVGGEALEGRLANSIYQRFNKNVSIYNEYGPTEAAVGCMIYRFNPDTDYNRPVPIGRPIDNMQIHLLDQHLRPVPTGIPGEICIGGAGVAMGYLKRPDLTAQRFVNHAAHGPYNHKSQNTDSKQIPVPNSQTANHRLYRSGDLARRLLDGNIQFLGRKDNQVKIRGHRIELQEIENHLLRLNDIDEAVCIARRIQKGEEDGDLSICAYIVCRETPDHSELKEYLARRLPEYMAPDFFVQLDAIPLTLNGKVDQNALPQPSLTLSANYAPPRNGLERKLALIWAEVLGAAGEDLVGIDDNFFEIGGNSLKATILMARTHKELNVKIPLAQLFKTPRIRELAQFVRGLRHDRFEAIEPVEEKEYYPLSSAQKRMYIAWQMDSTDTSYNVSNLARLTGKIDLPRIRNAFQRLLQRHQSLRTSIITVRDEPFQKVHPPVPLEIECHEPVDREKDMAGTFIDKFIRPFDLFQPPLIRAGLFKTAPEEHILIVDKHHIITDGISFSILINDFIRLYNDAPLPPLKLQYKDYCHWQNQLAASGRMAVQEKFWLDTFQTIPPVLDIPTDFPRPPVRHIEKGDTIRRVLDNDLNRQLTERITETGATSYIFLLAIHNILLFKYTGQRDIVVLSPITGRSHADLDPVIGVFINMLAMRNRPDPQHSFIEFLSTVKETAIEAFENQDYQFETLVSRLGLQGEANRNPLSDTEFSINSNESKPGTMKGMKLESIGSRIKFAKFDLHFLVTERNNAFSIALRYSTELFKPATAETIFQHYIEILKQVLENPGISLEEIRLSMDAIHIQSEILNTEEGDFNF